MGREIVLTILKVVGLRFVSLITVLPLCVIFSKKEEKLENPNLIVNGIGFIANVVWLILVFILI